jgi:hypothetical protein
MHNLPHKKITLLCTLIFSCTIQGMMTQYSQDANLSHLLGSEFEPMLNPVILEYGEYELEISRNLAEKLPAIKTALNFNTQWEKGSRSIPRYKFLPQTPPQYGHKHILQLVNLCAQPEENYIITFDDLNPLHTLANELLVEESVTDTFSDRMLTRFNRTLANKDALATEQQNALCDYQKILNISNPEVIKELCEKAEEEGALDGMYHMMYTSPLWKAVMAEDSRISKLKTYFIKKEATANSIITPQFHAWLTKDPAKQVCDRLVQHKRSIRTALKAQSIDTTQSHLLSYWKKEYLDKNPEKNEGKIGQDEVLDYIQKIMSAGRFYSSYNPLLESLHDLYLLPVDFFPCRTLLITNSFNGKFLHLPLMAYLKKKGCSYYFTKNLNFFSLSQLSIEPVDWESIHAHTIEDIKIGKNCQILTPKKYATHYKCTELNSLIQFMHPITKRDILITAGSLGIIALNLSIAYFMHKHIIPFIQKNDAHNFLHTHVTDTNRHIYQLLHQTSEKSFSSPCKAVLDSALPKLSAQYTIDSDAVVQCNTNLGQLYTDDKIEAFGAKVFAFWGYCFSPLWTTAAAWGTLKKTCSYTYSKLLDIKKEIAEQE